MSQAAKLVDIYGEPIGPKSKVYSPLFRVSYEHINRPQEVDNKKGEKSKRWSLTGIFEKTTEKIIEEPSMAALVHLVAAVKKAKWNQPGVLKMPFRNGDDPELYDISQNPEYEGKWIINMGSKDREPGLVTAQLPKVAGKFQYIKDPKDFYSGCYAIAVLNAFFYDVDTEQGRSRGISLGLCSIIKMKDGEPLSTQHVADEDFQGLDPLAYGVEPINVDNSEMFNTADVLGDL